MILGFIVGLLFMAANLALAQTPTFQPNPHVYRITIDGCPHSPANRRQTGFRVRGQAGIVTALHGLADCPAADINAEYSDGVLRGLALVAVDLDRDMALLTSPELAAGTTIGLAAPPKDTVALDGLYAIGHPYGKTYQEPTTQITITYMMTLNRIIPGVFLTDAFAERRSPDLQIRTLFAEAHFVPGHSGAPVLNAQNQVVGMVDGGLKEGFIGKSWLIPWSDVVWQPLYDAAGRLQPTIKARWELLQQNNPELALSFLSTYPEQPTSSANLIKVSGRLVDQQTNRSVGNTEVLLVFDKAGEYRVSYSDLRGFFVFEFAPSKDRAVGTIWIEADGYEYLPQPVDLGTARSFGRILLRRLSPTPTPQPTATVILATPTPHTCVKVKSLTNADEVSLREGPTGKVINTRVSVGEEVVVLNISDDRSAYEIGYKNEGRDIRGWLLAENLEISSLCSN